MNNADETSPTSVDRGQMSEAGAAVRTRKSPLKVFLQNKSGVAALVFLLLMITISVLAPALAPHEPSVQNLLNRLSGPTGEHWLGTDELGRDNLSRLLYGGRATLGAALIAVAVSIGIGMPTGLIAGFRGGRLDAVLSRGFEGLQSIPALILALTIVAVLGPGIVNAMSAVGLILAPLFFRVARATSSGVMEETFIEAAVSIGCSPRRILTRYVFPIVFPSIMVQVSVVLGLAVTAEASLSFLGLGIEPPTPSWGAMLNTASNSMHIAPGQVWAPGIIIFAVVLAFTVFGDALRKAISSSQVRSAN